MGLVWLFSGGGCLFLWAGLSLNNIELVIGGLFLIAILAVILLHNILTRHHSLKETKDEKIKKINSYSSTIFDNVIAEFNKLIK